jgi:hypothetical protein
MGRRGHVGVMAKAARCAKVFFCKQVVEANLLSRWERIRSLGREA